MLRHSKIEINIKVKKILYASEPSDGVLHVVPKSLLVKGMPYGYIFTNIVY